MKIDPEELETWRSSPLGAFICKLLKREIELQTRLHERAVWNPQTLSTPEAVTEYRLRLEEISAADRVVETIFGSPAEDLAARMETVNELDADA